ncbi:alkaline phosphatase D family protein (plasmid) [Bacillus sp. F19]|nr:alkaline phosphatase D family protein [Bacillus sp. F19]
MKKIDLQSEMLDRRNFFKKTGKGVAIALGASLIPTLSMNVAAAESTSNESSNIAYPFTLGIASGDPLPDGVVLWTRLAPDPLNGGGMPNHPFPVQWEVSLDANFINVVKRGTELSKPQLAHSVHVEVDGLEPATWYYYRFKSQSDFSSVGRTKTAPAYNSQVDELKFAFASCQSWPIGFYTAYQHMAKDDLDLVIHLGDYIYEGEHDTAIRPIDQVFPEIYTLDDYRNRFALYKSDSDLQAAHANFPWIVAFDDHEVDNNWAGEVPQDPHKQSRKDFLERRAVAFQAYYEHMPLRRTSLPNRSDIQLYRRLSFGNLVDFNVLDTRQYRDDQANGDGRSPQTPESLDPARTILGEQQERWLLDGLAESQSKWNVMAQQVTFAQREVQEGPGELYSMDGWDGYRPNRDRILSFIKENGISNFVVLTGDVHCNYVNEIREDFRDPNSINLGVEFIGTSITSGGDGSDVRPDTPVILKENPHTKFVNNQRGYVRCKLTQETWQADFMVVPYVSRPGAPISTRASFIIKDGKASVQQVAGEAVLS